MTWLDAAIIIVFLYFIVTAFSAGFIRETVAMASAVLAVVLAGLLYDNVANTVLGSIDNETTARVAGFLIVFVGVTLAGQAVAMLMKPAVTVLQLGMADQMLGAGFGAVKAFVIVAILLILFVTYPRMGLEKRIDSSTFAGIILDISSPMLAILPSEFDTKVAEVTRDVDT
jgi:membrane protein required for colicin V production